METEFSVRTISGKEYPIRFCGNTAIGTTHILYIEFIGKTMAEIIPVFSNKAETAVIEGLMGGESIETYSGYTNLIESIVLAESGNLRIALTAPMHVLGGDIE